MSRYRYSMVAVGQTNLERCDKVKEPDSVLIARETMTSQLLLTLSKCVFFRSRVFHIVHQQKRLNKCRACSVIYSSSLESACEEQAVQMCKPYCYTFCCCCCYCCSWSTMATTASGDTPFRKRSTIASRVAGLRPVSNRSDIAAATAQSSICRKTASLRNGGGGILCCVCVLYSVL
jgi:hypothetical protein